MTIGTEYTDSGAYTFHVGPMAELQARDGRVNPDVATDQYAITVAALNNGPDDALDAEETIDLTSLPAGVTAEDHIASDGTYSAGTWDLAHTNQSDCDADATAGGSWHEGAVYDYNDGNDTDIPLTAHAAPAAVGKARRPCGA